MDGLCSKNADDDLKLQQKIRCFIEDRNITSVTGIRRMGRGNLILFFKKICDEESVECSIWPDLSSRNIVVFDYWTNMESCIKELLKSNPNLDIVYGQDLCHQVPALVRLNKKDL